LITKFIELMSAVPAQHLQEEGESDATMKAEKENDKMILVPEYSTGETGCWTICS
jgi:hypothetical protein